MGDRVGLNRLAPFEQLYVERSDASFLSLLASITPYTFLGGRLTLAVGKTFDLRAPYAEMLRAYSVSQNISSYP
jgi:hypothetical protein